MHLKDKVAVVTGGANGIGLALCQRFAAEGRTAWSWPISMAAGANAAAEIGGLAVSVDVSRRRRRASAGRRSQAKVRTDRPVLFERRHCHRRRPRSADADWQTIWDINLMAHVYAARAVLPAMLERGDGYLLQTSSAAGLLTSIGSAPYAVTKHAAVALAEWLSITYGPTIKVSCLCPQGVFTNMLMRPDAGAATEFLRAEAVTPEQVADAVIEGLAAETFLILPHKVVAKYMTNKATDYDRWIRGMRKLQAKIQTASA